MGEDKDTPPFLRPNINIDKSSLIVTASADYDTASVGNRGNSSTQIPFDIKELETNKSIEYLTNIISSVKSQ